MRTALLLAFAAVLPGTAFAANGELQWNYDGHAQLPDAATDAKRSGKRLLVGLAGSPS